MGTQNRQQTASSPLKDEIKHPPEEDLDQLPSTIFQPVRDAISPQTAALPKATSFEPLSFDTPKGWKLTTCQTGGNIDINGRFELTRWNHPFYSDIIVDSPQGEDIYRAKAEENSPFHTGSRYVAYIRACQHITECRNPPTPTRTRLKNLATRNLTLKTKQRKIESVIDTWSENYPTETIRKEVTQTLHRNGAHYILHQLQQTGYIEDHSRSWEDTIGTPVNHE